MSFVDAGNKVLEGVAAGLYEGGTIIMAQADILVPVDTGTLKRSGVVQEPVEEADSISVTVGFGYGGPYGSYAEEQDPDGPGYGVYVHEITRYKHKPPTQAKFLEVPATAMGPMLPEIIAANVKQRTER